MLLLDIFMKIIGQFEYYEIFLCLMGSDGSLISFGLFILLVECYGLMNKVDMWVVDNMFKVLELNFVYVDKLGKVVINLLGIILGDEMILFKIIQCM